APRQGRSGGARSARAFDPRRVAAPISWQKFPHREVRLKRPETTARSRQYAPSASCRHVPGGRGLAARRPTPELGQIRKIHHGIGECRLTQYIKESSVFGMIRELYRASVKFFLRERPPVENLMEPDPITVVPTPKLNKRGHFFIVVRLHRHVDL